MKLTESEDDTEPVGTGELLGTLVWLTGESEALMDETAGPSEGAVPVELGPVVVNVNRVKESVP